MKPAPTGIAFAAFKPVNALRFLQQRHPFLQRVLVRPLLWLWCLPAVSVVSLAFFHKITAL